MKPILVYGSANIDLVLGVDKMPRKGETKRSLSFDIIPGGKGANQACAAAKLGAPVRFLGAVGADGYGKILLDSLSSAGVDVLYVASAERIPTGMAVITVDSEGENSIIIVHGANGVCSEKFVDENLALIEQAELCLVQLEVPHESVYRFIECCSSAHKTVIFNPAPAVHNIPDRVFQMVDYITPNETELELMSGIKTDDDESLIKAARVFINKGAKNVIVTLGPRGALHVDKCSESFYPGFSVRALDTTAAGDTFNAALAVALSEDREIENAIRFANAAAAISVTRKGAQVSVPSRAETEQFIKNGL